ncbi:MAG: phenylalanine 4-monooxygenase [Acidimicrobiia bacterium]|nr:phenylalanine 4-monooxygenase [Acidimicrobiia bacterium]
MKTATPRPPEELTPQARARRQEIASQAAGPLRPPADIEYSADEHDIWVAVNEALAPVWQRHAADEVLAARDRLGLPRDRLPQLTEVSTLLDQLTGFEYRAVPGLVDKLDFFASLGRGLFLSTQYVRDGASPLYTPEPDVIHEVIGHANCLADEQLAELHRLAGQAMLRVETEVARQFLADVFWFSGEFGVVRQHGRPKGYGAGLLSSYGELRWFPTHAELRPLDVVRMGCLAYDIDHYQPVLFIADSLTQVLDVVGGFFESVTDGQVAAALAA